MACRIRLLRPPDPPHAAAPPAPVGQNRTEADRGVFLRVGAALAVDDGEERALAAIASATQPFGREAARISLVLARPDRLG